MKPASNAGNLLVHYNSRYAIHNAGMVDTAFWEPVYAYIRVYTRIYGPLPVVYIRKNNSYV